MWRVELGIIILVLIAAIVPSMICDRFGISGNSMEPTLMAGGHVFVNKLIMGGRIYTKYDFEDPTMECFRMPGFGKMEVGDIAVFNVPFGRENNKIEFKINYVYAKRCIGIPGDTVSILNGYYRNSRFARKVIGVEERQRFLAEHSDSTLSAMRIGYKTHYHPTDNIWTLKEFGPLYVPKRGEGIDITQQILPLYQSAIEYENGILPQVKDGKVWLGDEQIDKYVFKENWYFFGGDNVLNSKDSRFFGCVPEDFIVGIVFRR